MTTRLNDTIVIEPSGQITVCAWCVLPARLAELSQTYLVSHAMCPACAARFLEDAR